MARKVEVDFKLLIVAVALVILATVGSAFATFLIFGGGVAELAGSGSGSNTEGNTPRSMGPVYEVGEFTVNVKNSDARGSRFVRTGIVLEISDDRSLRSELENRHPQLRDRIITLLRGKTAAQIDSTEGLETLRTEIVSSINDLLIHGEVVDVYFIDLVLQ